MCMEDIRVMREAVARTVAVNVAATKSEIVPRNAKRVALVLPAGASQAVFWSMEVGEGDSVGIPLAAGQAPIVLDVQHHGALVFGPWSASAPGGAQTLSYAEAVLEKT